MNLSSIDKAQALKFFMGLSVLNTLFYLLGFAALSDSPSTIRNLAWYQYGSTYFGLSDMVISTSSGTMVISYFGFDCDSDACSTCWTNGDAAGAFCFMALSASLFNVILNYQLIQYPYTGTRNSCVSIQCIILLFSIIAFGSFKNCPDAMTNGGNYTLGPGLNLPLAAFFFTLFNLVYVLTIKDLTPGNRMFFFYGTGGYAGVGGVSYSVAACVQPPVYPQAPQANPLHYPPQPPSGYPIQQQPASYAQPNAYFPAANVAYPSQSPVIAHVERVEEQENPNPSSPFQKFSEEHI